MANVHGGNLHHPNTEAIKDRCIRTNFHHYSTLVMGRTLDLPSVIELAPCKYKRVYFYFGVQKKLITY
jgi:hypothetical protein